MRTLVWWTITVAWWGAALTLFPVGQAQFPADQVTATGHSWRIVAGLGYVLALLAGWLYAGLPRGFFWLLPAILLTVIALYSIGYAWAGALDHGRTVTTSLSGWMMIPALGITSFLAFLVGYGLSSLRRALFGSGGALSQVD